jgi:hypothetical protein
MVRRIANFLLAMMPVIFVAGVSSNGRVEPPMADEVRFGPQNHAKILAYVEPVRQAWRALNEIDPKGRAVAVREASRHWIHLWESGQLGEIRNTAFEPTYRETVLGGIGETKVALMSELESMSADSDPDRAARDLILAIKLGQVSKYADLAETHHFSFKQTRNMERLERLCGKVSDDVRSEIASTLRAYLADKPRIDECVLAVRSAHTRLLSRQGRQTSALKLARSYHELAQATLEPSLVASALTKKISRSIPLEAAEGITGVITVARLAKSTDDGARKKAQAVLASLAGPSVAHDQEAGLKRLNGHYRRNDHH